MNSLIIGGTSGLGLELAREMSVDHDDVFIVGRTNPDVDFATFKEFDLATGDLPARIGKFVLDLPEISSLMYVAGYFQDGHITDLTDDEVDKMFDVGGRGLLFFVKKLLEKQAHLDELVTVTSTSQWTPREFESVYNFVKAGAAHYSNGQSLDPRVEKTLVVAPSGMDTDFWIDTGVDRSRFLDPSWVAKEIVKLRKENDAYLYAQILREPSRVEIQDRRSKDGTS